MLKRILWALVPVIASRVLNKKRGQQQNQQPRADKRRYDNGRGRQ